MTQKATARRETAHLAGRSGERDGGRHRLRGAGPCACQHLPAGRLHPALPLGCGACGRWSARRSRRSTGSGTRSAGRWRCTRSSPMRRRPGSGDGCRTRSARRNAPESSPTGIETAVRQAAGLDAVLEEEQAELLRLVSRMAAAAERRDMHGRDAPRRGAGVAFPPLKRRIRSIPPDKAAHCLARPLPGPRRVGRGAGAAYRGGCSSGWFGPRNGSGASCGRRLTCTGTGRAGRSWSRRCCCRAPLAAAVAAATLRYGRRPSRRVLPVGPARRDHGGLHDARGIVEGKSDGGRARLGRGPRSGARTGLR